MNTRFLKPLFVALLCGTVMLPPGALAQSTAFTYQGKLEDSGHPATGLYEMTFALYDQPNAVNPLPGASTTLTTPVTNGLFTVLLDFGSAPFNGNPRWMQTSVRTNGNSTPPVALTPRTPVASAPYATYAQKAGSVADNSIKEPQVAPGAVVKSLNGLKDDVVLAAGNNISLAANGHTITITSSGSGTLALPFTGSGSSASPLFGVNNTGAGSAISAGSASTDGIVGATASSVSQIAGVRGVASSAAGTVVGVYGRAVASPDGTGVVGYGAATGGYFTSTRPDGRAGVFDGTVSVNGNVGIGAWTPLAKLQVNEAGNSGIGVFAGDRTPFGAALFETDVTTPGTHAWFAENGERVFSVTAGGEGYFKGKLSAASGAEMVGNWDGGQVALRLSGEKPTINFVGDAASGNAAWLLHLGSDGPGNLGFFHSGVIRAGEVFRPVWENILTMATSGNVGIGTPSPASKLHVAGDINYDGHLTKLDVADNFSAYVRAADFNLGYSGRRGSPGRALVDLGDTLAVNFASDWANTSIGGNNVSVCTLTIRGGCDLAEPFQMSEEKIPVGSVVVIDEANPGHLKQATSAYDTRVAGIVSGANGINAGIALHQEGVLEGGQNVALTGRVYVKADASYGAIKPGDLLTTSDTPGHAMKVNHPHQAQGAILGKAMTALEKGAGMVLVLVTLQ